jgi:DNA polymerase-3 subunit beta
MAKADIENKNDDHSELSFSFIVPTKTVNELYKLLKDDERESVRIYMTRRNIVFNIGNLTFFSRLIERQYIDFDRAIMKNHRITANCNRAALISALERAALVTEDKVAGSVPSQVKLSFEEGMLKISAVSTMGSTYDEVEINHNGEDMFIAFNNRYLIDSVRACRSERIVMSLSSALTSINIEPEENEEGCEDIFMLLPVRMKDQV